MSKVHINKLSVYLIKDKYTCHQDILKNYDKLHSQEIPGAGTFYFSKSYNYKPKWLENFFGQSLSTREELFGSTAKGVLFSSVSVDCEQVRIFAVTFGYGRTLLNPSVFEQKFGLKIALNIVNPDHLRKIDKKNMTLRPKYTSEQLSQLGGIADFGIEIEQDLVRSVAGKVRTEHKEKFGATVTGQDALCVSSRVDTSNLEAFLKECHKQYISDVYKANFDWIDYIAEIRDREVVEELNKELVGEIRKLIQDDDNKDWTKVWMSVPEIIEWSDIREFVYKKVGKNYKKYDDIFLTDFLDSLSEQEKSDLNLDILKKKEVKCYSASSDDLKCRWKVYACLNCEVRLDEKKKVYFLSGGGWYEIETDFVQEINNAYEQIRGLEPVVNLPAYKHNSENNYNVDVAKQNKNYYCMDNKIISHGGGRSKVEFCDLITRNKQIIHVKRYGGSSVINHLFSQGSVSGELFLADVEFRKKVNQKLPQSFRIMDVVDSPRATDYQVVFAIISASRNELEIPFFSKIGLRNTKRRLETFGYRVVLQKIDVQR